MPVALRDQDEWTSREPREHDARPECEPAGGRAEDEPDACDDAVRAGKGVSTAIWQCLQVFKSVSVVLRVFRVSFIGVDGVSRLVQLCFAVSGASRVLYFG